MTPAYQIVVECRQCKPMQVWDASREKAIFSQLDIATYANVDDCDGEEDEANIDVADADADGLPNETAAGAWKTELGRVLAEQAEIQALIE